MGRIVFYFACVCTAFVVKGLAGFGDPLISTPLLSLALPNSVITPGLAPVSLILNANVVWKNRAHFSARVVLPIAAFVLLGIIPGTLLLKFGSPQGLKLVLGLLIIGLGVEMLTRKPDANANPNVYIRTAVSFFSGLTAGLFGINLLFLAYMERVTVNREEFRANACFIFLLDNVFRMILLLAEGMYGPESILLSIVALPAAAVGMMLGTLLDKRISDGFSRRIIIYVFILGGVSTTVYALLQLL
ncbi:sulfite exporter TauE/SafE family protein [uncultured Oscillibacter sp.]|uniref:sulfite exporter TauE/SafE family protein n=1 Tax=uncultured Oscillibacter sp. TaxID=876091 RepID=UPI00262C74F7|nr:sulfite exporter TauE/SafE family protein [uncultured Oscillibacter sp.]